MNPSTFTYQWHDQLPSTNDHALELLRRGEAENGLVVLALEQSAGRGQRQNHWHSAAGENLTMSVVLKFQNWSVDYQFALNMAAALAVYRCLSSELGDALTIKWPNDIFYRHFKIGGLLVENGVQGNRLAYSVVGIGLNVNQQHFPNELRQARSLKQITGRDYDLQRLATGICRELKQLVERIDTGKREELRQNYVVALFGLNEDRTFVNNGSEITGQIVDVDALGRLVVRDKAGRVRRFGFKEVEWVFDS